MVKPWPFQWENDDKHGLPRLPLLARIGHRKVSSTKGIQLVESGNSWSLYIAGRPPEVQNIEVCWYAFREWIVGILVCHVRSCAPWWVKTFEHVDGFDSVEARLWNPVNIPMSVPTTFFICTWHQKTIKRCHFEWFHVSGCLELPLTANPEYLFTYHNKTNPTIGV